jgi:hypothetical protein
MDSRLETMFKRMGARLKFRETVSRWHRVLMNTENLAPGARALVFLD